MTCAPLIMAVAPAPSTCSRSCPASWHAQAPEDLRLHAMTRRPSCMTTDMNRRNRGLVGSEIPRPNLTPDARPVVGRPRLWDRPVGALTFGADEVPGRGCSASARFTNELRNDECLRAEVLRIALSRPPAAEHPHRGASHNWRTTPRAPPAPTARWPYG